MVWTREFTMCELLAVSTSRPARLTFSLKTLASRGAGSGTMHDGWGVAFYQGNDVALFREPFAAAESELVRHLETHGPITNLAISHIRHATQGRVELANTQPFVRELGGRTHCFAHNGSLTGIEDDARLQPGDRYRAVGQTDSELAFCALLSRLSKLWKENTQPSLEARQLVVASFAADIARLGPANFLYCDGDVLFAHGHQRLQSAMGRIAPPGLWTLQRVCKTPESPPAHQGGLAVEGADQSVVFIASVPLTAEAWRPLAEGEVIAVRAGELLVNPLQVSNLSGRAAIPDN
jgi:predicted glutamine amidotransferase